MRERIGDYILEQILGKGGMGLVYKSRNEKLGRDVAIKMLLPKDAGDEGLRQRLLREARAQAHLQHPNIVAIYDVGEADGEVFIAMEFVEGENVLQRLSRCPNDRMQLADALPLFDQVLAALAYVHSEQIVHRDVTPRNVMLCGDRVKLADFGLALLADASRLTTTGRVAGTLRYMSPEQLEAKSIDCRTDIYSAALVLFRMLAGRDAFDVHDFLPHVHARLAGAPELRDIVPEVPAAVCEALAIALAYDPDERFPSAATFRDQLHGASQGFHPLAAPLPQPEADQYDPNAKTEPLPERAARTQRKRSSATVWAVVALSIAIGGYALFERLHRPSEFPRRVPVVARSAAMPSTTIVVTTAAPVSQPQPEPQRETAHPNEPPKAVPFAMPPRDTRADEERERQALLDALRAELRERLAIVAKEIDAKAFTAATDELDVAAGKAQRFAAELASERAEITRLRNVVSAAQLEQSVSELWASQLAIAERHLRAEHWLEAEVAAQAVTNDVRAPAAVVTRARELLAQAHAGRINAFHDTQIGQTVNTIRKPSSPPRNKR